MVTEVLRQAAHFRNLPEEALERLAKCFRTVEVAADGSLYEEGDPNEALFVVVEGTVLLFSGRHGEKGRAMARLCSGDIAGTADLFDAQLHSEAARALDDCVVLRAPRTEIHEFLQDHPQVALNLRLTAARDLTTRAKLALSVAQRRSTRHRVQRKVRLWPANEGAMPSTLVDVSPYGMSLRGAPESWQPEIYVECRLEWGSRRLDLAGRVAWREGDLLGIDLRAPSAEIQQQTGRMLEEMLRTPE